MDVPFFDPTSLPFPEGIEKNYKKNRPLPHCGTKPTKQDGNQQFKNTFSVNSPETPPSASFNNNDFFSTTNYPQPQPQPPNNSAYGFDVSPHPLQLHTVPSNNNSNLQPIADPATMAEELPQPAYRNVNDQATGATTTKYVSRHELTEKIKIITTLQEYKERGTSVQNLTINDSLEDLNIELERVRRFVQIHGTVDSYKTGLILFVNIVELVNKFSRRHFPS